MKGFEIVAVPRRDDAAAARRHPHTAPLNFQFERPGQAQQDLEVTMAVAPGRCAVVAQRELVGGVHGATPPR